jgi:hypothetical protein
MKKIFVKQTNLIQNNDLKQQKEKIKSFKSNALLTITFNNINVKLKKNNLTQPSYISENELSQNHNFKKEQVIVRGSGCRDSVKNQC